MSMKGRRSASRKMSYRRVHSELLLLDISLLSLVKVVDRTTWCASQHAAIRISPKPHSSSEYVGCSRQRGAVADDLKAAGPTTKYNSWWHARLRRAGGEPVQQDFETKEIQLTDSLP
ncbi:hypothetical protein ACFX13_004118 [Malus domestica]